MNCASCGAPPENDHTVCDAPHAAAAAGTRGSSGVAGFKVARELGSGRFSQTWMVRDEGKGPLVLKLLRRYANDAATVQRFIAEAERLAAAAPRHPNLARPVAAGVHLVSAFFLVYEVGGDTTLADELRLRGRLAPVRALELCAQICEGLAALHLQGASHCDLKPANVGLSPGPDGEERAIVLDGYTRHLLDHAGLNGDEGPLPLSSAAYAAPDAVPDERSDLYSVGALLFHLLSGRLPVVGATAQELTFAHARHRALRLADVRHLAPAPLEDLLAALLAKDPAQRPHDAAGVAVSLRALLPLAVSAPPPPALDTPPRVQVRRARPERRPAKLAGVVLASACAALAVATLAVRGRAVLSAPGVAATSVAQTGPAADVQPQAAAVAGDSAPAGAGPDAVRSKSASELEHGPLRYAKTFERAQKALWTNRPAQAVAILQPLLAMPLSRRERAKAEHMMGDARARQGNKAAAASWYTRSLQLSQR